MSVTYEQTLYNSSLYLQAKALRYRLLREPLGLQFTDAELALDQEALHVAAVSNGDVAGCVQAQPGGDSAKIRQMAVAENMQRQNIGRSLLSCIETILQKQGCTYLHLDAREAAIPFYEACGYETEGELFLEKGLPHKRMHKQLGG